MKTQILSSVLVTFCLACAHKIDDTSLTENVPLTNTSVDSTINDPSPVIPESAKVCTQSLYQIKIDNRYSIIDIEIILSAWNAWIDIIGNNIQYELSIIDLTNDQSFEPCVIKIIKKEAPPKYTGWTIGWFDINNKPTTGRIWIEGNFNDDRYTWVVVAHETGHALSLAHSTDQNSVMYPSADRNSTITCIDKINLCKTWQCLPNC